jgi:hypothetical protein
MISSLRRNLQSEHLDRLIRLAMNPGSGAAAKPIADLSLQQLRELRDKIGSTLELAGYRIDPYSQAHLSEAKIQIQQCLEAQFVRNLGDINLRVSLPPIFLEPAGKD